MIVLLEACSSTLLATRLDIFGYRPMRSVVDQFSLSLSDHGCFLDMIEEKL